jgi:1-deoxy-D-xylulose-5-phosphate synthase
MAPSDSKEMFKMLNTAYLTDGVMCVRYPRGQSQVLDYVSDETVAIGKAKIVINGKKNAILSFGTTLKQAHIAAQKLNATLVDMRFVKPLDNELIIELANSHDKIISIEDNSVIGGAGSAINELLQANNIKTKLDIIGIPDEFSKQGTQEEQFELYGLNSESIIKVAVK